MLKQDEALLRRIIELSDRELPANEPTITQFIAHKYRSAFFDEVAGVNLDIHRYEHKRIGKHKAKQVTKARETQQDQDLRREALHGLRALEGLVQYALPTNKIKWFGSIGKLAKRLQPIDPEQLINMPLLLRATKAGRDYIDQKDNPREAGPAAEQDTKPKLPALSNMAAHVYDMLVDLPPHYAMTGPKIIDALAKQKIYISESTLTRRIIPELKPYGIENARRIGYRIPKKR